MINLTAFLIKIVMFKLKFYIFMIIYIRIKLLWSGKRDLNPRPLPWQGNALPAELFPQKEIVKSLPAFSRMSNSFLLPAQPFEAIL